MTACRNNYKLIYKKVKVEKKSDNKEKEMKLEYFLILYYLLLLSALSRDIKPIK